MSDSRCGSLSRSMPSLPVFSPERSARAADPQQARAPVRKPVLAHRALQTSALGKSFAMLFVDSLSDRPECPRAWSGHFPPVARLLVRLGSSSMHEEAKQEFICAAIEGGMSPLEIDPHYGRPVLHWACILAPAELLGSLLQSGAAAHVNFEDAAGNTPLQCVLRLRQPAGSARVVKVLLDAGASLATLPHRGAELLYLYDLDPSLVRRLLSLGVDVNGDGASEASPLQQAMARRLWGLASLLLEHGADIARPDALRASVLHDGRMPVWLAEQLWRRGADVNARDLVGTTPLMRAVSYRNVPLVRWLLSKGAQTDAVTAGGLTVFDYARHAGENLLACLGQPSLAGIDGD